MLRDPLWTEFLADEDGADRFVAQSCRYWEVRCLPHGQVTTSGKLTAEGAVDWLDSGTQGMTRLPITGQSRAILFRKTSGRDGFPNLPFTSADVQRLVGDVGLPSRYFASHVKLHRIAAHFKSGEDESWFFRNWLFSVVTLQRKRDKANISIIIVDDQREHLKIDRLIQELHDAYKHSPHPFLPILILAEHAIEELRRKDCSEAMLRSAKIHASLKLPVDHLGPKEAFEIAEITVGDRRDLTRDRETLTQLYGTLNSLHASLEVLQKEHASFVHRISQPAISPNVLNQLAPSISTFESLIDYHLSTSADMLSRMQQIETRLQWLFPMLQLEQAKRDTSVSIQLAKLTQRDSSSMMVIAVLTTFFLPGTFVATLMSSPGYNNWTTDETWKYWAVTVPLTLVVMVAIAVWMWLMGFGRRQKEEDYDRLSLKQRVGGRKVETGVEDGGGVDEAESDDVELGTMSGKDSARRRMWQIIRHKL